MSDRKHARDDNAGGEHAIPEPKKHHFEPIELQKRQLDKLLEKIDKPVHIPERRTPKTSTREPKDYVKNVQGSSAGAGSGEFHVYRAGRRREYARLKNMDLESKAAREQREYEEKMAAKREADEEKTEKNRSKRQRRKQRASNNSANTKKEKQTTTARSDDEGEHDYRNDKGSDKEGEGSDQDGNKTQLRQTARSLSLNNNKLTPKYNRMASPASSLKRERNARTESSDDDFASASSASPTPILKKSKSPSGEVEEQKTTSQTEQLEAIFRNLRLRRIVKENHSSEINQLAFCINNRHNPAPYGLDQVKTFEKRGSVKRDPDDNSNILGTTGGPQANIYDNEHCGDHLDIMSHFLLDPVVEDGTEELPEMLTCCWLYQPQDAILASAGTDKLIHILSLSRSKELVRLGGHTHTITDIQAHPTRDECLLSASKDGTVRLWNVNTGKCLIIFEIKASVTCFNPSSDGQTFLTGGYNGEIREWTLPTLESDPEEPIVVLANDSRVLQSSLHTARIDCIRFAKGSVLSKSVNGKVEYWNPSTLEKLRTFNIRNTASNQCRFDVSLDELFFCVGTSNGSVYVYNIESGKTVTELKYRRSTKAIRTCIFSRDSRTVVCAGEDSFIWRYDYVTNEILNEWANWKAES
ncbi:hypothetical protein BG004_003999 [Podila humilis]|nr:hypothetical protein BG004_003999 [Podila humilis]